MVQLPRALRAWNTPAFEATLKDELEQLGAGHLPLQQGLSASSQVLDGEISVMLIKAAELPDRIRVRVGVFYAGIIAGCNCADDPSPVDANPEYCELWVEIDKSGAHVRVALTEDHGHD